MKPETERDEAKAKARKRQDAVRLETKKRQLAEQKVIKVLDDASEEMMNEDV